MSAPIPPACPDLLRRCAGRAGPAAALTGTVLAAAGASYTAFARSFGERWNATDEEVSAVLPGDALITDPATPLTRAITIDAPPERVWPWIAQFGQGRGGLYSYDWLENLFGCDIHSLDAIDPALQTLAVGDRILITPAGHPADLGMVVDEVVPGRVLVLRLSTPKQPFARTEAPWTWTFVLAPDGAGRTRLISRERFRRGTAVADALNRQIVGPIDFVMSRRMLTGIAERAERAEGAERAERVGGSTARPWGSEPVWFAGLVLSAAGLIVTLASELPMRQRLCVAGGGGAALTAITFRLWTPWASMPVAFTTGALAVAARRAPRDGSPAVRTRRAR